MIQVRLYIVEKFSILYALQNKEIIENVVDHLIRNFRALNCVLEKLILLYKQI